MDLRPSHEKLAAFAGHWVGHGEVFPNPWGPGGPTRGEWRFRRDASGFNLIHDYVETRSEAFVFEGHGVLTIDPADDLPVWFWFDSFGFPPLSPSRGVWQAETLVLTKESPRGFGRSSFRIEGQRLHYDVASRPADATDFTPVARGEFLRQP